MKIRKIISGILKFMIYAFVISGVFLGIGGVGSFEWNTITFGQFIFQEFLAIILIFLAFIVYIIRNFFNYTSY